MRWLLPGCIVIVFAGCSQSVVQFPSNSNCIPDSGCATNPGAPCINGQTVCGETASCVDFTPADAGVSCGIDRVCNGRGSCVGCRGAMRCTPNMNAPCITGAISCATGEEVCEATGMLDAGTACGFDRVCSSAGECAVCAAGVACATNPAGPCVTGVTQCSTGARICADGLVVPAGTACGTNLFCDSDGGCRSCTQGAACMMNPGAPCLTGMLDCSTGVGICKDATAAAAGTSCGTGQVCAGDGGCIACVTGSPCATNTNTPCRTGKLACSTGAAQCVDDGNAMAGTACPGGVCTGTGSCVACVENEQCATNPGAPCRLGRVSCVTGARECIDDANAAAGTSCTGGVCTGNGSCVSCVENAACPSNASAPCRLGRISCGSGSPQCVDAANADAGTPCTGGVCTGAGSCVACVENASCPTNGGAPCRRGRLACGSGTPQCVDAANADAGTPCTGGVCTGAGACTPCSEGASCPTNTGGPCVLGAIACSSGSAVCVDTVVKLDAGTSCGLGVVCSPSSNCIACVAGSSCVGNLNACLRGALVCSTGVPTCTDGPTPIDGGVPCAGNRVCDGTGTCAMPTSCWAHKQVNPGAASGLYFIDPDGSGPNAAFQVYCDMVRNGGGWTLIAKLGDGVSPASKGPFTSDRDIAALNSGDPPATSQFSNFDLSRFNGYGSTWTVRIDVDSNNDQSKFQYTFYRPATGESVTPGTAGADWVSASLYTKMSYLSTTSLVGSSNTTWLPVPVFDSAGQSFAIFASRRDDQALNGVQCMSATNQTQTCHAPGGGVFNSAPASGTYSAAYGAQDGVTHLHARKGTYWLKQVNADGAP